MQYANSKLIYKNTIVLYCRMFIMMGLSLYTSRVVLQALGVEDYGTYNVIGGLVILLGFLNNSMAISVRRFYSFEIGRENKENLNKIFNISVLLHIIIAIVVLLLSETLGVWFLEKILNIPQMRMTAAKIVFQFTIFGFVLTIIQVPFQAIILAQERMNIFAMISILETLLKLIVALVLYWFKYDKLIFYSILMFGISFLILFSYEHYCRSKFIECKYKFVWDKGLTIEIIGFTGWSLISEIAWVLSNQGINILLNVFYGPIINAARGIAYQVNTAINRLVINFQTAVGPQIIKSYAANEREYLFKLIYRSTVYSYFLLLFISIPIMLEIDTILKLWLNVVPEYTSIFCQLIILGSMIDIVTNILATAAQATGNIKGYQLTVGVIILLNFPISYLMLKLGYQPQITLYVYNIIASTLVMVRLLLLRRMIGLSIKEFSRYVLSRTIAVTVISMIMPLIVLHLISVSLLRFLIVTMVSWLSIGISVYFVGLNKLEQEILGKIIKAKLIKLSFIPSLLHIK